MGWVALDLAQLKYRFRYCLQKMDLDLVHRLLAGTSARLDRVRRHDVIEKNK